MTTPVSFEIAKLLKEKGFDIEIDYGLNQILNLKSAPTIAEVVMWLYDTHKLDIIVRYPDSDTNKVEGINSVYYDLEIYRLSGGDAWKIYKRIDVSDDKTKAYTKAIEYCLNELI